MQVPVLLAVLHLLFQIPHSQNHQENARCLLPPAQEDSRQQQKAVESCKLPCCSHRKGRNGAGTGKVLHVCGLRASGATHEDQATDIAVKPIWFCS